MESDTVSETHRPCAERSGIVISRQGRMALVQVRESRGCAACTCTTSQARGQSTSTRTVTVVNIVDAEVGRHVRIVDSPRAAIAASAVLFGIPLLGVLCGALGMYWIAPLPSEDLNTLLGSAAGLALGAAAARATASLSFPGLNHAPQAVEILPDSTPPPLTDPSSSTPS
ncbi:SoxR reducing system RseC family protein [Desulfonatronum thiodismutans]|uniref:SoxR reducing system RseC family protein n=1 Tax=Desulfonatronum thiodismutans TaxID=159290 RepID=UPI0004ABD9DC|nr:SoxR reducing system RseC family protein [Desulfonatronum thiodismutans]